MKLHTGETQYDVTLNWSLEQRKQLGQELLYQLAEDMLIHYHNLTIGYQKKSLQQQIEDLTSYLELDGYIFKNSKLLIPEEDVLKIKEEIGILETLYDSLNLDCKEVSMHHLNLSEEHYLAKK